VWLLALALVLIGAIALSVRYERKPAPSIIPNVIDTDWLDRHTLVGVMQGRVGEDVAVRQAGADHDLQRALLKRIGGINGDLANAVVYRDTRSKCQIRCIWRGVVNWWLFVWLKNIHASFRPDLHARGMAEVNPVDNEAKAEYVAVRSCQAASFKFLHLHEGALGFSEGSLRKIRASLRGASSHKRHGKPKDRSNDLDPAYDYQPNRPIRDADVRIGNPRVDRFLTLAGLAFGLQLFGAWLWSGDSNRDRWLGGGLIGLGAVGFALNGLWWFGVL
jgi:hypothetical protein